MGRLTGAAHAFGSGRHRRRERSLPWVRHRRRRPSPLVQQGPRRWFRAAAEAPAPISVVHGNWDPGRAEAATHSLFDRDHAMTAVFACSDTMALGVYDALAARCAGLTLIPFHAYFRIRNIRSFGHPRRDPCNIHGGSQGSTSPGHGHLPGIRFIRRFRNVSETLTGDDAEQMMARSADPQPLPIRVSATARSSAASRCLVTCPAFTLEETRR